MVVLNRASLSFKISLCSTPIGNWQCRMFKGRRLLSCHNEIPSFMHFHTISVLVKKYVNIPSEK